MKEQFKIRRLGEVNVVVAGQLFNLFGEIFGTHSPSTASNPYLKKLLSDNAFICFAVFYNDVPVGGLTGYELPMYYTETSEIYLYDIAITSNFQRQGLGKALLSALRDYGKQNNIKTMFVDAELADTHALDFYRANGGHEMNVVQFTYQI